VRGVAVGLALAVVGTCTHEGAAGPISKLSVLGALGDAGASGASDGGAGGEGGAAGGGGEGGELALELPPRAECPRDCKKDTVEDAQECLEEVSRCLADSQARFESAKAALTSGATADASLLQKFLDSQSTLVLQERLYRSAQNQAGDLDDRYMRSRRFAFGVGPQVRLGHAAGDRAHFSAGGALTFRKSPGLELAFIPGYDVMTGLPSQSSDEKYRFFTTRAEVGFLSHSGVALVVGLGGAFRDPVPQRSMLLVPIVLRYRFEEALGGTVFGYGDLGLYVEPWIPLNGDSSAVLIGFSLGGGVGLPRLGAASDRCLGKHDFYRTRPGSNCTPAGE
jgi:hypothetical protein